jgi:hypothetical protein
MAEHERETDRKSKRDREKTETRRTRDGDKKGFEV